MYSDDPLHLAEIKADAAQRRVDVAFERRARAERDDRHAMRRAQLHDVRHLLRRMWKDDCVRRLRLYPSDCVAVLLAHREARHHAACELVLKLADDAGDRAVVQVRFLCCCDGSHRYSPRVSESDHHHFCRSRRSRMQLCAPVRLAASTGQNASASVAPISPLSVILDSPVHSKLHGHRPCAARAADDQEWRGSETGRSLVSGQRGHHSVCARLQYPCFPARSLACRSHCGRYVTHGAVSLQDGPDQPVAGFTHTRCAIFQPSLPHERGCARFLMGDDEVGTRKVSPNAVPFWTWLLRTTGAGLRTRHVTVFQANVEARLMPSNMP